MTASATAAREAAEHFDLVEPGLRVAMTAGLAATKLPAPVIAAGVEAGLRAMRAELEASSVVHIQAAHVEIVDKRGPT